MDHMSAVQTDYVIIYLGELEWDVDFVVDMLSLFHDLVTLGRHLHCGHMGR